MTKEQKLQFVNYINQIYSYQQSLVMKTSRDNINVLNAMSQGFEDMVKLINSCETTDVTEAKQAVDAAKKATEDANNATK